MATIFYTLWLLLSLAAVVHLLLNKREPSSTLAWLLFVTTFPIIGALLFLVFGPQRLEREAYKRKRVIRQIVSPPSRLIQANQTETSAQRASLPPEERAVLKLTRQISEYGVTEGNRVEMLADPHEALLAMQREIESARHFVHLEYYIIAGDEVTKQLFDCLLVAAKRGVEIRILYDALGSLYLRRRHFKELVKTGAKIAGFLPFSLVPQRINVNFRNHRKILVIDGTVAFTGGTNIGREYLGKRNKSQWHDYSVRVEGPVCRQLQDVFAKDWRFTTREDLFHTRYYPVRPSSGDSVIQVLESGPDSPFSLLHQTLFLMLNSAREEILLTTPYFVPDPAIMTALIGAALRGVRVRLVLPLKSDARLVQYASRSFYDALLRAGVEIYEYQPRILHAKMMIIDRRWTMLGSANMDIRSFRLNFELNLIIYGASMAEQASSLFQQDLLQSERVDVGTFSRRPIGQQMLENACRLL